MDLLLCLCEVQQGFCWMHEIACVSSDDVELYMSQAAVRARWFCEGELGRIEQIWQAMTAQGPSCTA